MEKRLEWILYPEKEHDYWGGRRNYGDNRKRSAADKMVC